MLNRSSPGDDFLNVIHLKLSQVKPSQFCVAIDAVFESKCRNLHLFLRLLSSFSHTISLSH